VLADAALFLGPAIGLIVLWGARVSIGGFTAGSALGSPRFAQAMASARVLPPVLARLHPRFETPHLAIVVTAALSAGLAFFLNDFGRLVEFSNLTIAVLYLFTCLAVPVLRRRATEHRGFVIPFGPLVPLLGAAGSLFMLGEAFRRDWQFCAVALVIIVALALGSWRLCSRHERP
jgi:amino acid transporter